MHQLALGCLGNTYISAQDSDRFLRQAGIHARLAKTLSSKVRNRLAPSALCTARTALRVRARVACTRRTRVRTDSPVSWRACPPPALSPPHATNGCQGCEAGRPGPEPGGLVPAPRGHGVTAGAQTGNESELRWRQAVALASARPAAPTPSSAGLSHATCAIEAAAGDGLLTGVWRGVGRAWNAPSTDLGVLVWSAPGSPAAPQPPRLRVSDPHPYRLSADEGVRGP